MNHFLKEIDRVERRHFKQAILASRAAQLARNDYLNYMRQLDTVEPQRQPRGGALPMTYEEQAKLDAQHHVRFRDMSPAQQAALSAERDSLWGQIPAHLQDKARKLAGR